LQVTNIFRAELDEKDLLPTSDKFYIRVSDASHIMYVMRLFARADHVLSNKLQLSQYVFIIVIFWYWLLCRGCFVHA
jgi:hypothetical protein